MNASNADSQASARSGADLIATQFVAARLQATSLPAYPGEVPDSLRAAYECQEAAIRKWPDAVAGWKVARIPAEWQSRYPSDRLIGPAFRSKVRVATPGTIVDCPIIEGGFAAVEAELVFRMGNDAPPAKSDWTPEQALELVASLHVGVEIASSPLASLNDLGSGAVISDFGNNWGVLVGPAIRDWRSVGEVAVQTLIDGTPVGRGTAVLQTGAIGALVFTLSQCALRGRPLRAGDVISTGMITGVHDIRIGQTSRHVFEGHGEVSCHATRQGQHLTADVKSA